MTHLINGHKAAPINPKKAFRVHLLVFLLAGAANWLVWALSGVAYPWPLWSTPAWAIGVIFHYLGVFVFKKSNNNKN